MGNDEYKVIFIKHLGKFQTFLVVIGVFFLGAGLCLTQELSCGYSPP
jgi:hypothetical protein